jgi:hypothetical protein
MKQLHTGLFAHGIFKGFANKQGRPNAQGIVRNKLQCAVEVLTRTEFGDVTEMKVFNVPDDLVNAGIPPRMSNLQDKAVMIPFTIREWEMNGRNGITINLCPSIKQLLDADAVLIKQADAKAA